MLRLHLGGIKDIQHIPARLRYPERVCHLGHALGQGPGLIQHDGIHLTKVFQGKSVFDQYMMLGAFTHPDHQGSWRSKSQRARASDHQYRYRR